jgi:hypothetical protein
LSKIFIGSEVNKEWEKAVQPNQERLKRKEASDYAGVFNYESWKHAYL